jgi:hypothetical protein
MLILVFFNPLTQRIFVPLLVKIKLKKKSKKKMKKKKIKKRKIKKKKLKKN